MITSPCSSDSSRRDLRLLFVSSDLYPPSRVDVSILFADELAGRGNSIDWILQSEAQCDRSYATEYGGGTVWVGATDVGTSRWRRLRKHLRGIRNDFRIFRLLRRTAYDMIIVKDKFITGLFAMAVSKLRGVKFVFWLSFPFPEASLHRVAAGTARYPWLYWIRGTTFRYLLYRILLPAADHVFVQSEQMRIDIAREGVPREKMTAVPMGVPNDLVTLELGQSRSRIPSNVRVVLYLGTMVKTRRLDFLIRVMAIVRQSVSDALLYMVGSGDDPSDQEMLVREAERLGMLDAIVFTGQLPRMEALQYVGEADVCVSPFYPTPILNSTSPTKLVEYMALGKAVVANDHPEQRLVIEESGAGYCVAYEEAPFARAVVDLLADPTAAQRMGRAGRKYATSNRTYAAIADQVEFELARIALKCPEGVR